MKAKFLFIISIVCLLLSLFSVSADILDPLTPYHPSYETSRIYLSINYNNTPIQQSYFSIFSCYESPHESINVPELNFSIFDSNKNCYWTNSYNQYFICASETCSELYRYPKTISSDARLIVFVPSLNKTFISESFILANENSYHVDLLQNGSIDMKELWIDYVDTGNNAAESAFEGLVLPFILTLLTEVIVAYIFLRIIKIKKQVKRILGFVLLGNLISWPIAAFLLLMFIYFLGLSAAILVELLVIVFEAYFIHWTNKKALDLRKSFGLSLAMNIASIIVGFLFL